MAGETVAGFKRGEHTDVGHGLLLWGQLTNLVETVEVIRQQREAEEGAYSIFEDKLEEELEIIELRALARRVGSLETRFTTMEGRLER